MASKEYPKVEPGDIVLIRRKPYNGPFKYLVTRLILFFTKATTSKVYHAEMAVENISPDEFRVITMEPPRCRNKDRSYDRKIIFRLKKRPADFRERFDRYVEGHRGIKYDFFKIVCFVLDFITMGSWFTRTFTNRSRDICSEYVAVFYKYGMEKPCSNKEPDSTAPDDIHDYCFTHGRAFKKIYED